MKRKFALILSAVMAASSLPLTAYAANFKDINDVPWAGAETVINSVEKEYQAVLDELAKEVADAAGKGAF